MVEWSSYTPITKEETITIDCHDYITVPPERKRGQHLGLEEREAIQQLKKQGYSLRAIAEYVNCSPSTVTYELRRGTPPRRSHKGRIPGYSDGNRRYIRPTGPTAKSPTISPAARLSSAGWYNKSWNTDGLWMLVWAMQGSTGCSRKMRWCAANPSTTNWQLLPLSLFEVPEALKRRRSNRKNQINKRPKGRSI